MRNSKKIAFLLYSLDGGGAERVVLNLAKGFCEQGHEVDIVLARKKGAYLKEADSRINIVDLKAPRAWQQLFALRKYFLQSRPDSIVANTTIVNLLGTMAWLLNGKKAQMVVCEHVEASAFISAGELQRARLVKLLVRFFYPLANARIAVAQGVAEGMQNNYGVSLESIRVIYNGVMEQSKYDLAAQLPSHPWCQSPRNKPTVVAVGRLEAQKDYATLINAIAEIRRLRPVQLLILGEGNQRQRLENLISELDLRDCVSMPGFDANPYAVMANSDVYVLSSVNEGLPTVLIEALACGAKVVSTDCPSGPSEILEQGKYGYLVPVGDSSALARAVVASLDGEPFEGAQSRGAEFTTDRALHEYSQILGL